MLAKKYRLQLAQYPRNRGTLKRGRYLFVSTLPSTLPYSRFAVIVPASVVPRATGRNKLRRSLYTALRPYTLRQPAVDSIITVQRAATKAPMYATLEELNSLIS